MLVFLSNGNGGHVDVRDWPYTRTRAIGFEATKTGGILLLFPRPLAAKKPRSNHRICECLSNPVIESQASYAGYANVLLISVSLYQSFAFYPFSVPHPNDDSGRVSSAKWLKLLSPE